MVRPDVPKSPSAAFANAPCYEWVDWLCGLAPSKPEVTNPARSTPLFGTGRAVKHPALLELQFAGRYDWATAIKVPGIVFRQLWMVDSEIRCFAADTQSRLPPVERQTLFRGHFVTHRNSVTKYVQWNQ